MRRCKALAVLEFDTRVRKNIFHKQLGKNVVIVFGSSLNYV